MAGPETKLEIGIIVGRWRQVPDLQSPTTVTRQRFQSIPGISVVPFRNQIIISLNSWYNERISLWISLYPAVLRDFVRESLRL